jgi:hypothetical protein
MAGELSPERARLLGSIGGFTAAATCDAKARTKPARDARWLGYLSRVDPDHILHPDERERRAKALQRADMARMRLRAHDLAEERKRAAAEAGVQ